MNFGDVPTPASAIGAIGAKLAKVRRAMVEGGAKGLYIAAEEIMTDSKDNYVPVRHGILRGSGFVKSPVIDVEAGNATVTLGFGGAAEAYALEQHERLDYHHTVGGPKYLERPIMAHSSNGDVQKHVGDAVQAAMAGALGG